MDEGGRESKSRINDKPRRLHASSMEVTLIQHNSPNSNIQIKAIVQPQQSTASDTE